MSLTIKISGIYLDPKAKPLPGYLLRFESLQNSSQTQQKIYVECLTDEQGAYSIELVPNAYAVTEWYQNRTKWLGNITIFADSPAGTLNEYLISFRGDQIQPGILSEMEEILEETKQAASDAGVTPKGAWTGTASYDTNDIVEYEGSQYIATGDVTGIEPPQNPWSLFVSKGDPAPNDATPTDPLKKTYLTFIDDDTRIETYTYWKRLADEMGVNITLSVVPDWVDGNYPEGKTAMNIGQLREMYNDGHNLVSHGFDSITVQENLDDPDALYKDLHDSQQWLIDNGFTRDEGYRCFVWPQGLSGDVLTQKRAKSEVRKYYRYAVNAFTKAYYLASGVFDSYDIPRVTGDTSSSEVLINAMKTAMANNGWLLVLTHAWHAVDQNHSNYDSWSSKYRDLINFARQSGVEIVTLSQGLKVKGNALSVGDWLDAPQCSYLNNDGSVYPGGLSMFLSASTDDSENPVTQYQRPSTAQIFLQNTHDTITGRGGVISVTRGWPNFSYRQYTPVSLSYILKSFWSEANKAWGPWLAISGAKGTSNMKASQDVLAKTPTKILFNSTPSINDDELESFDPPNARFVAQFGGKFRFDVKLASATAPADGSHISLNLYKNGSLFRVIYQGTQGTAGPFVISGSAVITLNAGEVIEVYINSTLPVTINSDNRYTSLIYSV